MVPAGILAATCHTPPNPQPKEEIAFEALQESRRDLLTKRKNCTLMTGCNIQSEVANGMA
jgi:hypothetical protein